MGCYQLVMFVDDSYLSFAGTNFSGHPDQVILGTTLGAIIGAKLPGLEMPRLSDLTGVLFSRLMRYAHRKGFIDRESYIAQYFALAMFTVGVTNSLGSDDLLAAFAAGVFDPRHVVFSYSSLHAGSAISWDGHFNEQTEDDSFSTILDLVLNCACFIYIGAWLPFDQFHIPELGITPWRLVWLMLAILVLRRIPFLLILYKLMPEVANWREALFCGHFGPVSLSSRTFPLN